MLNAGGQIWTHAQGGRILPKLAFIFGAVVPYISDFPAVSAAGTFFYGGCFFGLTSAGFTW